MTVAIEPSSEEVMPLWTPVHYTGDVYELSQRSQIVYHTLSNESVVLTVDWDEQLQQAVFRNQFGCYTTISTFQHEEITLHNVLLLHGILLGRVELLYDVSDVPNMHNILLDSPLKYIEPCQLQIWASDLNQSSRNAQG